MDYLNVSIGLAFLAGLASFFSPCVFSLVPAYVGYLSGRSISQTGAEGAPDKLHTFLHGVAFVLGFSFVFVSLGLAFSALSQFFFNIRDLMAKAGGVIIIIFGLHMTGLIKIPFLDYDLRPQSQLDKGRGFLSSFFMGIFFSAGWSPCVGPTLGLILTLAIDQANIGKGVGLLSIYSLGMAIPFLIAALGVGWVTQILRKYSKVMKIAQIIMGVILIIVGVLLFLGIYQQLVSFDALIDFGI
jgi:cytochrome c-type biogenesis protein